jgi:hypothetical protein
MPFGLTNAHVVFQHRMNDIFREYLDQFIVIYLDDILVFSSNIKQQYTHHVKLVLVKLREYRLYAKNEKCEFDRTSVDFFVYVISTQGITMDTQRLRLSDSGSFQLKYEKCNNFSVSPVFINVSSKNFQ